MNMILPLFGVVLAAAVADLLLPEDGGTRRYLHLLTSLAVLVLILNPVAGFLRGGVSGFDFSAMAGEASLEEYEQVFSNTLDGEGREAFASGVAGLICEHFQLDRACVEISVEYEGNDPSLVRVRLSGAGLLQDPRGVEAYLRERIGIEAEVR